MCDLWGRGNGRKESILLIVSSLVGTREGFPSSCCRSVIRRKMGARSWTIKYLALKSCDLAGTFCLAALGCSVSKILSVVVVGNEVYTCAEVGLQKIQATSELEITLLTEFI